MQAMASRAVTMALLFVVVLMALLQNRNSHDPSAVCGSNAFPTALRFSPENVFLSG